MTNFNFQTGQSDVGSIASSIDDDVKFDPLFSAMIKSLEHAITELSEQQQRENAKDKEDEMGYIRETYTFHSSEFEQAISFASEHFTRIHDITEDEKKENPSILAKFLNALSVISDGIVNTGLTKPGDLPSNPDLPTVSVYFEQIQVRKDFEDTFLKDHNMRIEMRPLYAQDDINQEFSTICQPILIITRDKKEYEFVLAPCRIYMPDWYLMLIEFYRKSNELLEDARIAMEDLDVATVEEVLESEAENWE